MLLAGLALAAIAIVGCGGGDSDDDQGTSPTVAPSATTAAAAVDLSKDDLGRQVTVPRSAQRVVAMSPSIVELMYSVGATPVGRPSSANFPSQAQSLPAFGTSYQPNFEEIVKMQPDLIIADAIIQQGMIEDLAKLGAPVFALKVSSFEEVTHSLRAVGALTGKTEAGEAKARELETKLAGVKSRTPQTGPSVLIVVAAGPGQFIAAKDSSYLGSLVKTLGGRNIVTSEPENFRFPGFADYSLERIVQADPDVIIGISIGGRPGTPKTTELLAQSPGWSSLKAVKAGNVKEVDQVIYLEAAGPRVSQILDELPRILYPTVFATR
ncbi:MAG TPA: ABC transporter substrate-binding protein [Dehalococcoidia bacterium]|nr:ABC transporter substrate-binding protein [Dehalococcoidia bacterium]